MTDVNFVKIQIQKGMGITQALKKLVEDQKMELSDGKITAKEWNSVLDKLVEIQNNRKANSQASIFSGGTDKTHAGWQNSFVVNPGQEIEFTAEEIGELYRAMGAKFSSGSKPPQAQTPAPAQMPTPTPAPTTAPAVEEATIPKKDENPPTKGEDFSNKKAPLDIQFVVRHPEKANQSILNEDGTTNVYDENGYLDKVLNEDCKAIRSFYRNSDGSVDYSDYEYDSNGNYTRGIEYKSDGSVSSYFDMKYFENGNMKTRKDYSSDGTLANVTEYDEDGNYLKEIEYEEDGKTPKKDE